VGAMPGAFDFLALNSALTERATPVGTRIIDSVEFSTEVEQSDALIFDFDTFGRLLGDLVA